MEQCMLEGFVQIDLPLGWWGMWVRIGRACHGRTSARRRDARGRNPMDREPTHVSSVTQPVSTLFMRMGEGGRG